MIHKNMSLRESLSEARRLGCAVGTNKTGEVVVDHERFPRPVRIHAARHDVTQQLVSWLRRLEEGSLTNPLRKGGVQVPFSSRRGHRHPDQAGGAA